MTRTASSICLISAIIAATAALGDSPRVVGRGSTIVVLQQETLAEFGVSVDWPAAASSASPSERGLLTVTPGARLGGADGFTLRHDERIVFRGAGGVLVLDGFALRGRPDGARIAVVDERNRAMLELRDVRLEDDPTASHAWIESRQLVFTTAGAKQLGAPALANQPVGYLVTRASFAEAPDAVERDTEVAQSRSVNLSCGGVTGPDVIIGKLPNITSYGSVGGVAAFAVGTTSCNLGGTELLWIYNRNMHPVIGQNMYRLKDGRFEQVGMSWLKHGFATLTGNLCGCGCVDPGTSQRLGIGCSDPYSSGLNGLQSLLGPRSEVNAHTGEYLYPHGAKGVSGDAIYKRLQVHISDLDPAQDGGGVYFAESHYITADDATGDNADNNAAYRQVVISGGGTSWTASFSGMPATERGQAAIRAWKASDPSVVETDVRVPDEGLVLLAAQAEALGGGMWHYEYALQNLNSDRSIRGVSIPVIDSAVVQNISFHDVDYHSGEPYDGTDWTGTRVSGAVDWMTDTFDVNSNANALRWSSLYNFRFDADAPPQDTTIALALFKPGKPQAPDIVFARTVGPTPQLLDCNSNGIADDSDIAGGDSQDCNTNGLPDECEDFSAVRIAAVELAAGLDQPVAAAAPPGDFQRLFICEQNTGRIRILKNDVLLPTPFLDIGALISASGERGLLGIAFHPNYASNGHFYVDYTDLSGDTVVARYSVSTGDADIASNGTALIIKTILQDGPLHNGGQLAFGPDGYLYVATGDGANGGDPFNRAQDPNSLLGKILRLDVDAAPPYVPATNPYVGTTGLDEIWALGLRNPWRISFDRLIGDLYIADNGESALEEIDFQSVSSTGGENYGWRCYEGTAAFNLAGCAAPAAYEFPLLEYAHIGGACSIIGGYVYRGCALPQLRGTYFYADFCAGWVRSFRYVDGDATPPVAQDRTGEFAGIDGAITSFAEDAAGELYVLADSGKVYRIEPAQGTGTCGNNVIEIGELCDDGNTSFGDGCDEHCQLEGLAEDFCAGALPLCPDATAVGDTTGAASDGTASCGDAAGSPAQWYRYLPVADDAAILETCGSSFDTVLSVHRGCPATVDNQLTCNDDGCGMGNQGSRVVIAVDAGETYYVRVAGHDGSAGSYALTVSGPGCAAVCGNDIVELGEECEPPGEAGCSPQCQFNICENPIYTEGFESPTPPGWTFDAAGSTATEGGWVAGDPDGTNTGGSFVQPEDAFAGTGCAFTATNTALNSGDVDGGVTYLVSPLFDLSAQTNTKVRYARWFHNGVQGDDVNDFFIAEVSDDDGASWVTLELLDDTQQANAWVEAAFELEPLIALTNQVRVRFGVSDGAGVDDLIEAAIDAFQLSFCNDCNSNGVDDATDIATGASTDLNTNSLPDDCEADGDALRGGLMYDRWPTISNGLTPSGDHPLWPFRPDLISNSRTGLETWRCKECHGWDYQGVNGAYATGSHRTGFPGILGTTLSNEDIFTLLAQPPTNDGGPGVLNGHDLAAYMSTVDILDLVAFVRVGMVDTDLYIDGGGAFTADAVQGQTNYQTNPTGPSCLVCHGADGTSIDFGTPLNPQWVGNVATDNPWEFLHKVRYGQPGSSMPNYLSHGTTQGAADIGAYVQQNFPTQCFLDSHCDDANSCNGDETCGTNGCEAGVFTGCDVGCDNDCDVDLADFAIFQRCYTGDIGVGPPVYPPGCDCFDFDADGDVDRNDHAEFLTRISGADIPAAGCLPP